MTIESADMAGMSLAVDQAETQVNQLVDLIECLIDTGECWFDHHGGCQGHGYLDLKPGQICPQEDAKRVVREHKAGRAG